MDVDFLVRDPASNDELNSLFQASWPGPHAEIDFRPILACSLSYICARKDGRLVGFVNLAWDGGAHAFLLDPTVHPQHRRKGIGSELVRRARDLACENGVHWLHVDYEPHLRNFYRRCGFRESIAGLMDLTG